MMCTRDTTEGVPYLGVLQFIVPAFLSKCVLVINALGVQDRIQVDIHQVVKILLHAATPTSSDGIELTRTTWIALKDKPAIR